MKKSSNVIDSLETVKCHHHKRKAKHLLLQRHVKLFVIRVCHANLQMLSKSTVSHVRV